MTTPSLQSICACAPGRYELTFELPDGRTRTFGCRVDTETAGVVPVWESLFNEVMGGRNAHVKQELTWLVSFFHCARQTEWIWPLGLETSGPLRASGQPVRVTRPGKRPVYDTAFTAGAVAMVLSGQTVADVARALGCSARQVRRWLREAEAATASPGGAEGGVSGDVLREPPPSPEAG